MQPKIKNATFATQCHPYQNMRYHSKKNRNFDTKLRFFFYPQKTLNKGISQKKKSFFVILYTFIGRKYCHRTLFLNSR